MGSLTEIRRPCEVSSSLHLTVHLRLLCFIDHCVLSEIKTTLRRIVFSDIGYKMASKSNLSCEMVLKERKGYILPASI